VVTPMYKVPFRSLAMMYTNGIVKRQRYWTPACAGVTLFEVIALKLIGLDISKLHGLMISKLHGLMVSKLHGLMVSKLHGLMVSKLHGLMVSKLHGLVTLKLYDLIALKLSSRRRPGSSVVRTIVINA